MSVSGLQWLTGNFSKKVKWLLLSFRFYFILKRPQKCNLAFQRSQMLGRWTSQQHFVSPWHPPASTSKLSLVFIHLINFITTVVKVIFIGCRSAGLTIKKKRSEHQVKKNARFTSIQKFAKLLEISKSRLTNHSVSQIHTDAIKKTNNSYKLKPTSSDDCTRYIGHCSTLYCNSPSF